MGEGAGLGEPQLPSWPLLVTPTGWAELAAETVGGGYFGRPHLYPRNHPW